MKLLMFGNGVKLIAIFLEPYRRTSSLDVVYEKTMPEEIINNIKTRVLGADCFQEGCDIHFIKCFV